MQRWEHEARYHVHVLLFRTRSISSCVRLNDQPRRSVNARQVSRVAKKGGNMLTSDLKIQEPMHKKEAASKATHEATNRAREMDHRSNSHLAEAPPIANMLWISQFAPGSRLAFIQENSQFAVEAASQIILWNSPFAPALK